MSPTPTNENPSQPIAIESNSSPTRAKDRRRSSSLMSNPGLSPSTSPVSPTMSAIQTPSSFSSTFPRPPASSPTTATSPLSYFLAGSPVKSTFPWSNGLPAGGGGGGGGIGAQTKGLGDNNSAIAEEEDSTLHKVGHARAASTNWSTTGHDRAAGVMRRLSLGGALSSTKPPASASSPDKTSRRFNSPPSPPHAAEVKNPNDTVILSPTPAPAGHSRKSPVKKRSVSPMGERMLKGHFDGFGL